MCMQIMPLRGFPKLKPHPKCMDAQNFPALRSFEELPESQILETYKETCT
jgi:hypothetical protein